MLTLRVSDLPDVTLVMVTIAEWTPGGSACTPEVNVTTIGVDSPGTSVPLVSDKPTQGSLAVAVHDAGVVERLRIVYVFVAGLGAPPIERVAMRGVSGMVVISSLCTSA